MNHNPATPAIDDAADGLNIHAFLQQAVDHYPCLAAFSFTALLPRSGTMTDNRALIMRFLTEVWQRIGEYSWQRQQARRHSPPTILRWIWEPVGTAECKMVLLMNLNTLETVRDPSLIDSALQDMNVAITDMWWAVVKADNNVTSMSSFIISRSDKNAFSVPFSRLKARMDNMVHPVTTAKTGVICP